MRELKLFIDFNTHIVIIPNLNSVSICTEAYLVLRQKSKIENFSTILKKKSSSQIFFGGEDPVYAEFDD